MGKQLFITGTGTDVGKTYISALILKKFRENNINTAYYKAAMSGNERHADGTLIPGDAQFVKSISGITQPLEEMCRMYTRPLYPLIWLPRSREIRWKWKPCWIIMTAYAPNTTM